MFSDQLLRVLERRAAESENLISEPERAGFESEIADEVIIEAGADSFFESTLRIARLFPSFSVFGAGAAFVTEARPAFAQVG